MKGKIAVIYVYYEWKIYNHINVSYEKTQKLEIKKERDEVLHTLMRITRQKK